jgi:hypothetical protein
MTVPHYRDTTGAWAEPRPVTVRSGRVVGGRKSRATWVALDGPATPESLALVGELLSGQTVKRLMLTTNVAEPNLDFLADLPALQALWVLRTEAPDLRVLSEHADSLQELHLELRGRVALDPLAALPHLRRLYLRKTGSGVVKGAPEALAAASELEHLVLHSVTLPTLSPLTGLPQLRGLALKLGGAPDLTDFPQLPALRFFEAWQVRGLENLDPVAESRTLEVLWLQNLSRVELPNFSHAVALRHVLIAACPLRDGLARLAAAPNLLQASVAGRRYSMTEVDGLLRHPTLQAAYVTLEGRPTDEEMRLGLPSRPHRAPFVAFGAGVMGLPPADWEGQYLQD